MSETSGMSGKGETIALIADGVYCVDRVGWVVGFEADHSALEKDCR